MAGIVTDIDNLKRDIEKTTQALSALYLQLGKVGCNYHKAIAYHPSDDRFEELCKALDAYNQAEDELEQIDTARRQVDSNGNEISKTNTSLHELDKRRDTLLSSLGAIACEMQASGNLPSSLEDCLSSVNDCQDRMQALIEKRDSLSPSTPSLVVSMYEKRISNCRQNMNSAFLSTGRKLAENPAVYEITNTRVQVILQELELIRRQRKSFNTILNFREKSLSVVSSSLRERVDGTTNLVAQKKVLEKELEECYIRYGSSIASGMDLWLDSHAPEEIKSLCDRIRVELRRLDVQQLNMDYLLAQRDIQMDYNQVKQLEIQLKYLKSQRSALDAQIREIQEKVDKYNNSVALLRQRQQEIARKASK